MARSVSGLSVRSCNIIRQIHFDLIRFFLFHSLSRQTAVNLNFFQYFIESICSTAFACLFVRLLYRPQITCIDFCLVDLSFPCQEGKNLVIEWENRKFRGFQLPTKSTNANKNHTHEQSFSRAGWKSAGRVMCNLLHLLKKWIHILCYKCMRAGEISNSHIAQSSHHCLKLEHETTEKKVYHFNPHIWISCEKWTILLLFSLFFSSIHNVLDSEQFFIFGILNSIVFDTYREVERESKKKYLEHFST